MISLSRARPNSRHQGSRLYENWGSLTDSSFNQIERSELAVPGGSKAARDFQTEPRPEHMTPGPGTYSEKGSENLGYRRAASPPLSTVRPFRIRGHRGRSSSLHWWSRLP